MRVHNKRKSEPNIATVKTEKYLSHGTSGNEAARERGLFIFFSFLSLFVHSYCDSILHGNTMLVLTTTKILVSCISTWSRTLFPFPLPLAVFVFLSFLFSPFCTTFSLGLSSLLSQVYSPLFLFNRSKQGEVLFQFKLMTYNILLTNPAYTCPEGRPKCQFPIHEYN